MSMSRIQFPSRCTPAPDPSLEVAIPSHACQAALAKGLCICTFGELASLSRQATRSLERPVIHANQADLRPSVLNIPYHARVSRCGVQQRAWLACATIQASSSTTNEEPDEAMRQGGCCTTAPPQTSRGKANDTLNSCMQQLGDQKQPSRTCCALEKA